MVILRSKDIRGMSATDLNKKKDEIRQEFMKLRAQRSAGSAPENPGRIRALRRTIARIITIQGQKMEVLPKKQ
jgi:large subunit ribosomal protein L29